MMDPRASSSSSHNHYHDQQQNEKEQQRIIILQSIRSIRATIMNLSTNNNYNDYFGAELDVLIGNLEDDNECLLFEDFDDGAAGMDSQLGTTDHPCDDDDDSVSDETSSSVTPMKIEEDCVPTPCISRPHQEQEERQQSFQMGAGAVNNFNPPAQHYHHQHHHQQHITHLRQSDICSDLSMSSMESSTAAAPRVVNVNQHQGTETESPFQQQQEHPYTKVQYDRALQNLAESMKRTEVSRRQIMMLKRTEMTRHHVTMTRGMLSHEQQRVLHLAKMQLNQQQHQHVQQVQQAHHHHQDQQ